MSVLTVSNSTELANALGQAQGGDTIVLAGGYYDNLRIINQTFDQEVRLVAADPNDKPVIEQMLVHGSSNVTFEGLHFSWERAPLNDQVPFIAEVRMSDNIKFVDSQFSGFNDTDISNDETYALLVRGSSNVTLENSEFFNLFRGAAFLDNQNVVVRDNSFHDMRMDGLNFAEVRDVLIEGNHFTDFYPQPADHPDFIQFWSFNATKSSENVVIRDNVMLQGDGGKVQGIFLGNEWAIPHKNFTIENNLYYGSSYHGISATVMEGATIQDNTIISVPGSGGISGINILSSNGVTLDDNITTAYRVDAQSTNVNSTDLLLVSETGLNAQASYDEVFRDGFAGKNASVDSLVPLSSADALLNGGTIGFTPDPSDLSGPAFEIATQTYAGSKESLNANFAIAGDLSGLNGVADNAITWDLGDGASATGRAVSHSFGSGGSYDVTVTVATAGGDLVQRKTVLVDDTVHLGLSFDQTSDLGALGVVASAGTLSIVPGPDGDALRFGGDGYATFARDARLSGAKDLDIALDFKPEAFGKGSQYLLWTNAKYGIVMQDNAIDFRVYLSDGQEIFARVQVSNLSDGNWHSLRLTYDGEAGVMQAYVDGTLGAEKTGVQGQLPPTGDRDILLGGAPWGGAYQGLVDNVFIGTDVSSGNVTPISSPAPAPADPAPADPAPADPAPADPAPSDPAPADPAPSDPAPSNPDPVDPAPTDPAPTDPAPTDPAPTDPAPTDPAPAPVPPAPAPAASLSGVSVEALNAKLTGDGYLSLSRPDQLYGMDSFALVVDFQMTDNVSGREVLFWNHVRYGLYIENGHIVANVTTEGGSGQVWMKGPKIEVNADHTYRVMLQYDDVANEISLWVDDEVVANRTGVSGDIGDRAFWDITVGGSPWWGEFDSGIDNVWLFRETGDTSGAFISAAADAHLAGLTDTGQPGVFVMSGNGADWLA